MDEASAQAVILVRAVEGTDASGRLLSHAERRQATQSSSQNVEASAADGAWIANRAARLIESLDARFEVLPKLRRWSRFGKGLALPAVVLAGLLGLAGQGLGSDRHISVLAVPLLILVAWNFGVVVFGTVARWLPLGSLDAPWASAFFRWWRNSLGSRLRSAVASSASATASSKKSSKHGDEETEEPVEDLLQQAGHRYLDDWLRCAKPLALARVRRILHLGSMSLVAGTVVGMYWRGLVREYSVGWESTFLSGQQVDAILGTVLAPAAWLLGREVPSVALFPWPETFDAAPFIHLWAATALLFVGLPRLLLVGLEGWKIRRLERRLPVHLPEAYRRRLQAAGKTESQRVELWTYSYQPSVKGIEAGKRLLLDLLGGRTEIHFAPPLAYGDRLQDRHEEAASSSPSGRCLVVLFNLSQTPEKEVHGEFLRDLKEELVPGQAMLVWVDTGTLSKRLQGHTAVERLAEKQRSWERVLRGEQLDAVFLDLEAPQDQDLLRSGEVAWPPGTLDE